jgi:hypothetical protein
MEQAEPAGALQKRYYVEAIEEGGLLPRCMERFCEHTGQSMPRQPLEKLQSADGPEFGITLRAREVHLNSTQARIIDYYLDIATRIRSDNAFALVQNCQMVD